MQRVAIVTGATSGIGSALCERLLQEDENIHLCLACRNMEKANATRDNLLSSFPRAHISIVKIDVGRLESVLHAAQEIKTRFHRLDYLFLNAGAMVNPHISFWALLCGLFSSRVFRMLSTAEGLMTQQDRITPEGLQEVFATNFFGHFVLIRQLEPLLCCLEKPSQLIWTSSVNAHKSNFNLDDIQHKQGKEAYSSSKYCTDLTSVALNNHFNKQGLFSSVMCPGIVMTNLTYEMMSPLLWKLFFPFFWLLRLCTPTFTLAPYNGAEAQIWLFKQKPELLDSLVKYHSCTTILGRNYTESRKLGTVLHAFVEVNLSPRNHIMAFKVQQDFFFSGIMPEKTNKQSIYLILHVTTAARIIFPQWKNEGILSDEAIIKKNTRMHRDDRLTIRLKEKEEMEYYQTWDLFYRWLEEKIKD